MTELLTELPHFDVLLTRLARHHELSTADLSRLAAVPEDEIRAVLDGAAPKPSLLRRLAPVLRLHPEDLFVIASRPLPPEMTPLEPLTWPAVSDLVRHALTLPRQEQHRLRRLAASLPQDRTRPALEDRPYLRYPPGPGGLLMRLLANRNLGWSGTARMFLFMTDRYWSSATYGQVGRGKVELTPELQADYATVLGIPADDLAVLTGIGLPDGHRPPPRGTAEVAGLIRDVRRLSQEQIEGLLATTEGGRP